MDTIRVSLDILMIFDQMGKFFSILSKSNVENFHIFEDPSKVSEKSKALYAVNSKYFYEKKSN